MIRNSETRTSRSSGGQQRQSLVARIRTHLAQSRFKLANTANHLTGCTGRKLKRDASSIEDLRSKVLAEEKKRQRELEMHYNHTANKAGTLTNPSTPALLPAEDSTARRMTRDDTAVRYTFAEITNSNDNNNNNNNNTASSSKSTQHQQSSSPLLINAATTSEQGKRSTGSKNDDSVFVPSDLPAIERGDDENLSVTVVEQEPFGDSNKQTTAVISAQPTPHHVRSSNSVFDRIRNITRPRQRANTVEVSDLPNNLPPTPETSNSTSSKLPNSPAETSPCNTLGKTSAAVKQQLIGEGSLPPTATYYRLTIYLNEAHDLIAMDRCGTSDPYVRVKVDGKTAYKTKIIMRDLDPVWNETCVIELDRLQQHSVVLSLWDYDRGSVSDDFLGAVELDVTALELDKIINHRMVLKEKIGSSNSNNTNNANGDGSASVQRRYLGFIMFSTLLKPISIAEMMNELKYRKQQQSSTSPGDWDWRKVRSEFSSIMNSNQTWRQLVHVVVVDVCNVALPPVFTADNNTPSVYIRIAYGNDNERTKAAPLSLRRSRVATFKEAFNFYSRDEILPDIVVELYDADANEILGRVPIEISRLAIDQTHRIAKRFVEDTGTIEMTVTLTGTRQDVLLKQDQPVIPTWRPGGDPVFPPSILLDPEPVQVRRLEEIFKMRNMARTPGDYCGLLILKVIQARNLTAADIIGGKSDPFCVIEVVNVFLRTHTEYKTLEPKWNRIYMIPIDDVNSVLTITVFDEDRDKRADFLGKLAIPLLQLQNCSRRWFALKTNRLAPTVSRGYIEIEARLVYNTTRAVLRAINPKEEPFQATDAKISIKDLQRDVGRLKQFGNQGKIAAVLMFDCINWVSPIKSILALVFWIIGVYFFELWMAPFAIGLLFVVTYFMQQNGVLQNDDRVLIDDQPQDTTDGVDDSKLSLKDKLAKVQEVALTAQRLVNEIASTLERIRNIVLWRSPWVSAVFLVALFIVSAVIYLIPLRWLALAWGINKLTKKKLRPWALDNFEPYDLISRAASDIEMAQYRDIPIDKRVLHDIHRQRTREEQRARNKQEHQDAADTVSTPPESPLSPAPIVKKNN